MSRTIPATGATLFHLNWIRFICVAALCLSVCTLVQRLAAESWNVEFVGQIGGVCNAVKVVGNYAYIGEGPNLRILDISNPASPVSRGRILLPEIVEDVFVSGNLAYIAEGSGGLQIIDITNPSQPWIRGSYDTPGYAVDVYASGGLAYVADGDYWSGSEWVGDFRIIDVSNPSSPTLRGSLDTMGYASGVTVVGYLAYVADGWQGLSIIDVRNPSQPVLHASYDTPWATDVCVSGGMAFVADNCGLWILDVSNPSSPMIRGYCEASGANAVTVSGGFAYVTGWEKLWIIDVRNPSQPALRGSCDLPEAEDVFISGVLVYVASGAQGLSIIDVANPAQPSLRGRRSSAPGYAGNVFVSGNLAYIVEGSGGGTGGYYGGSYGGYGGYGGGQGGIKIMDISNPSEPTFRGAYETTQSYINDVCVSGGLAYLAQDYNGLQILDVTNPAAPRLCGSYATPGYPRGVFASGGLAYVADGERWDGEESVGSFQVLDVSNPSSPTLRGSYEPKKGVDAVIVVGGLAYITQGYKGFQIIDVSDPSRPSLRGSYNTPGYVYDISVSGDLACVADDWKGLQIIDISNPSSPTLRATCASTGNVDGVRLSGGLAYCADRYYGYLNVVDVTNPSRPLLRGYYRVPDYAEDLWVGGGLIYVGGGSSGLWILRYTGPALPARPSGLAASPTFWNQINLSWQDNSDNENGFRVERKTGVSGAWSQIAAVLPNVTAYESNGLSANTLYYYRVRAYNTIGNSDWSNEAWATTPLQPDLTVSSASVTPPLGFPGNGVQVGFKMTNTGGPVASPSWAHVYLSPDAQLGTNDYLWRSGIRVPALPAGGSFDFSEMLVLPQLASGQYYVLIQCDVLDEVIESNEGNNVHGQLIFTILGTGSVSAPSNLTAFPIFWNQISLSWRDNSNNEDEFRIERKMGSSGSWSQVGAAGANVTTYQDIGLSGNTRYYYRVRGHNSTGPSSYSNEASAQTPQRPTSVRPAWSLTD